MSDDAERDELRQLAAEHAGDLIVVLEGDGRIVFASPAHRTMLGYAAADVEGRHALSFVHPREVRAAAAAVAASLAGEPASARVRVRRRDGGWVTVDAATAPIPPSSGRPSRALLVGRDVTDLVAAERRLRTAAEVARALAESASRADAGPRVLEAIARGLGWDGAVLWAVDSRAAELICEAAWSRPGAIAAGRAGDRVQGATLAAGEGVGGRAWAERRPIWLVEDEARDAAGPCGPAEGLRAAAAVPVSAGADVLGAIELIDRRARRPDEAELQLLEALGLQLGQFLERRRAEDALRASDALKRAVVESALDCVVTVDERGLVLDFNPAAESTFGYSRGEVLGRPMVDLLLAPRARARFREGMRRHLESGAGDLVGRRVETTAIRGDGTRLPAEVTIMPVTAAGPAAFCAVLRDITRRKLAEARIAHLAYHDPLTDLPNRQMLREHLAKAVARADRAGTDVALLLIDLDEFKLVNDSLGHTAGDLVMREVARRLEMTVRTTDLVAREAGDEFLLLISDLPRDGQVGSLERAERAAASAVAALEPPFSAAGTEITVAASVGISIYPRDATSAAELLRNADAAMYQARRLGRSAAVSAAASPAGAHAELSLISRLRGALARDELAVLYQPIVRLPTASGGRPRVIGAEALVRWNDRGAGLRQPAEFIPFAERVGLIHQIGAFVFGRACDEARRWAGQGTPLAVSVNLSPVELWHPDTPDRLVEVARQRGVDPSMITIEVTESAVMRDPDQVAAVLGRLREAGFGVAIDDFGIGHSSLERLAELPATVLKVDRSFVQRAPRDPVAAALVQTIVELAYRLDLEPIAEGIETTLEADFVAGVSCRLGQGYRYGRPMPAGDLGALVRG